jgi:nucleoid-associated protein YgaU
LRNTLIVVALAAAALIGAAAWIWREPPQQAPLIAAPGPYRSAPAKTPAAPAPAPAKVADPAAPSFDVARASPDAPAVLAGRAPAGSHVRVLDGDGKEIGTARADRAGEWAIVTAGPLAAGAHELRLEAELGDGRKLASEGPLALAIPESDKGPTGALVVALAEKPGQASRALQQPGPESPRAGALALGAVDYDDAGDLVLGGSAPPGSTVRAYLNDRPLGAATADSAGRWTLRPDGPVAAGQHALRVDQLGPGGKVVSRVEAPFSRAAPAVVAALARSGQHIVVQPGNSLWRIARSIYGAGMRYTVIYRANQEQIRDPDLIYPGQVFGLPQAKTQ